MKITGAEKAAKDFNSWKGYAKVFVNYKTGNTWTYIYKSATEDTMNMNVSEIEIMKKNKLKEMENTTTPKEIVKIAKKEIKNLKTYWITIDD